MTDTLTPMDHVEAIRELRARGYVVIAPDKREEWCNEVECLVVYGQFTLDEAITMYEAEAAK